MEILRADPPSKQQVQPKKAEKKGKKKAKKDDRQDESRKATTATAEDKADQQESHPPQLVDLTSQLMQDPSAEQPALPQLSLGQELVNPLMPQPPLPMPGFAGQHLPRQ